MTMVLVSSWLLLLFGFSSGALNHQGTLDKFSKAVRKKIAQRTLSLVSMDAKLKVVGSEVLSACSWQFLSCLYALDLQQNLELDNSRSFFLVVKLR
jgi:hypothetical protein